MPSPPRAMVRSTSPHSDPLSIIHAASGGLAQTPRVLCARADPIVDSDPDPVANKSIANNYTAGQPTDGRLTLGPGAVPASPVGPGHSQPAALPHAPTTTVRVTVIICSAVGAAVFVATILALIYAMRIRRRVRRIQGCTNVLGPELAPASPSKSSQISLDSLFNHDGLPPATPDQMGHDLPLGAQIGSSQARIKRPSESPSVPPILTITVSPPPAAVRRSILHPNTWSPIPSSPIIIAWPNPETRWRDSLVGYPAA